MNRDVVDLCKDTFADAAAAFVDKQQESGSAHPATIINAELSAIIENNAKAPFPASEYEKALVGAKLDKKNLELSRAVRNIGDALRAVTIPDDVDVHDCFKKAKLRDTEKHISGATKSMSVLKNAMPVIEGDKNMPQADKQKWASAYNVASKNLSEAIKRRMSPVFERLMKASEDMSKLTKKLPEESNEKEFMAFLTAKSTSSSKLADSQKAIESALEDMKKVCVRMGDKGIYTTIGGFTELVPE